MSAAVKAVGDPELVPLVTDLVEFLRESRAFDPGYEWRAGETVGKLYRWLQVS